MKIVMHERTQLMLTLLEHTDWFENVGRKENGSTVVLSSWSEAVETCASPEWEEVQLAAANRVSEVLAAKHRERYRDWNAITEEIKSASIPLVERKIARVTEVNGLPKIFVDTVRWDAHWNCYRVRRYILSGELEFFATQAYWYTKGHFPCGWNGSFPTGEFVIY